jgi:hypothetical protein
MLFVGGVHDVDVFLSGLSKLAWVFPQSLQT